MAESPEQPESRFVPWLTGLIIVAVVFAGITIWMGLFEGTVRFAIFVGCISLTAAVAAWVTSRGIGAMKGGATVALVVAVIAFGSGLQSALLGTGQINSI